ncbi:Protein CHROMATIN REMODELING 20 [Diplonema papillatum]|nr:Protein CHROMATIN REMODELING 20 [Diplonema papillatum]
MLNWEVEYEKWAAKGNLKEGNTKLKCYRIDTVVSVPQRAAVVAEWDRSGGLLFMGYEAYLNLVGDKAKQKIGSATYSALKKALARPGPDILICDEGHRIKTSFSATAMVLKKIATQKRVSLTGTPLQNHLMEYFSMLDFVRPGFFTPMYFASYFRHPIESGQKWDAAEHEIALMKERAFVLAKEVDPFVLRRDQLILKASLPEKKEFVVYCPLGDFQRKIFASFRKAQMEKTLGKQRSLLSYITGLNKAAGHPDLLYRFLKKQQQSDVAQSVDWGQKVLDTYASERYEPGKIGSSPKLMAFLYLYSACAKRGQKMLFFSQYVETLDFVEKTLKTFITSGLTLFRLDGSHSTELRERAITGFQTWTKSCVFLISTRAGGIGINLNTAHCAVLFDVSFNPSHDQQAVFRCYRYGLKHPVAVYRLVGDETPEAIMYERAVSKEWMSRRIVDQAAPTRDFVTTVDLRSIMSEDARPDEPEHIKEQWIREKQLCLLRSEELREVASHLHKRGVIIRKVHRHESLLIDKLSESAGKKEEEAYLRYLMHNAREDDFANEDSGSSSEKDQGQGRKKKKKLKRTGEAESSSNSDEDAFVRILKESQETYKKDQQRREQSRGDFGAQAVEQGDAAGLSGEPASGFDGRLLASSDEDGLPDDVLALRIAERKKKRSRNIVGAALPASLTSSRRGDRIAKRSRESGGVEEAAEGSDEEKDFQLALKLSMEEADRTKRPRRARNNPATRSIAEASTSLLEENAPNDADDEEEQLRLVLALSKAEYETAKDSELQDEGAPQNPATQSSSSHTAPANLFPGTQPPANSGPFCPFSVLEEPSRAAVAQAALPKAHRPDRSAEIWGARGDGGAKPKADRHVIIDCEDDSPFDFESEAASQQHRAEAEPVPGEDAGINEEAFDEGIFCFGDPLPGDRQQPINIEQLETNLFQHLVQDEVYDVDEDSDELVSLYPS